MCSIIGIVNHDLCYLIFCTICCNPFAPATNVIKALSGPKYDGQYLHEIIQEKLPKKRLQKALTNIVIPTFDIKYLQPETIKLFSQIKTLKNIPSLDAKISDICIGTSAAPTYLPPHSFQTQDSDGKLLLEFNLIVTNLNSKKAQIYSMKSRTVTA
ncbi:putative patatin-like phospholipase domain, Acyl transferase/acyl hydrolase/lysophospholipase [Helianthus annuus]|uniref:Patatin-like phospholipase domain, Acyl transferase/acyl hydrolase/lysophospholipase n=1 Tax=Helianthus annuus TaxID=4232 RepID=A0A251VDU4_HELAN|nr:putative patatin-like phospholipase domain, Acyl transferase/acyl hydrolase/lysophospholipase [Helianthus annuus]